MLQAFNFPPMSDTSIDLTSTSVAPSRSGSSAITPVIEVESHATVGTSKSFTLPFDPLRVVDGVYAWRWPALAVGLALAAGLWMFGMKRFQTHHTAVAQLILQSSGNTLRQSEGGDPYQPHEMTIPTMIALMRSSTVTEKTAQQLEGKVSEGTLRAGLVITPERNTDIIKVAINSDTDAETALASLQAYVAEVLKLSQSIQQADAGEMNRLLEKQIAQSEKELLKINEEILDYSKREGLIDPDKQTDALLGELGNYSLKYEGLKLDHETLDLKIASIEKELSKVSPAAAKLQTAREELTQLQLRYTNEHPSVIEGMDRVKSLESTLQGEKVRLDNPPKPGESSVAESLYLELVKLRGEKQVLGEQLIKLAAVSAGLNAKLEQLPRKSLDLARIKSRKVALEASRDLLAARQREAALVESNAQGSFRLLSMARHQDVIVEKPMKKIVMVTVGGFAGGAGFIALLSGLLALRDRRLRTPADLKRATKLPVLAALSERSALDDETTEDWAFRTWTNLCPTLAATNDRTVVCGLLCDEANAMPHLLGEAAAKRGASVIVISRRESTASVRLADAVLIPEKVLSHLAAHPESSIELHLGDQWTWDANQRQQWLVAITQWSAAGNLVVLVELDQPQRAETLLVAERLPNLLWVGSSCSESAKVRQHIGLYHAAGCRLIGALLDRAPSFRLPMLNKLAATACVLLASVHLHASDAVPLGAGDIINITVAGQPELERKGITVAPDGTVTYLQARSVPASGKTLDELRLTLSRELSRFYKQAIVIVTPNLFQSRKAYVLGKVVKKGAINLDRPMTVLELVAEAGGLETGLFQQNTVELADLGRSFLMRGNARLPVNMESLFMRGDMTQNVPVLPGDYLYFPSANANEIYVLGNVKMQGTQGLLAHTSVHSAIAQAGGFTPRAYTKRVLVVRGTLDKPQTFTVNMDDIMNARTTGFRLEPKDIVYIADKPWARAEELLSFALNAFFQGAVSGWTGANAGPMLKAAVLPTLR